uniref:MIP18 family-like domain-containing protein n=1 Tax=Favella ehrenbergii TaxID=182087 RepID=A0A7S3I1S4_9SPIT|mmetsp:Transcript_20769/g.28034  ORF Transcript_20769/g.28034 Transcript_20769/m.28034 type:complete len:130 (+) Transcript_20769:163-552(+)|eukprot:Macronucleus_7806.p1 GENE.Macronucleus_7806~~Macronucleus_7806.p1  ORF type:complete len:130 (+),score=24.94 Macronucleus_7806:1-390(+)
MIRHITDPEHPNSLEELAVLNLEDIHVNLPTNEVQVYFTPTIPNCGMATLIGLMIRVKLIRSLPMRFKVDIYIKAGKHEQEAEINKQLNDKERVLAALENPNLLRMVNTGLKDSEKQLGDYLRTLKFSI